MTRLILLILFLSTCPALLHAQSDFSFGFEGGIGISGWQERNDGPQEHLFTDAKSLGLFTAYKLPYRLRAIAEVSFLQSGSLYKDTAPSAPPGSFSTPSQVTYDVQRIYAPVTVAYDLLKTRVTPFVRWGFGPAFIHRASRGYRTGASSIETVQELDLDVAYNRSLRLSFPTVAAVGVRAFNRLSVEASLMLGNKFYYRFQADDAVCYEGCTPPELSYNNRVIMFAAAYNILP